MQFLVVQLAKLVLTKIFKLCTYNDIILCDGKLTLTVRTYLILFILLTMTRFGVLF